MATHSDIIELFQHRRLRLSEQRLLIYSYLLEHRTHPAAEGIYRDLLPDHPSLSLTTVYNTLRFLAENRLIVPVMIEDGEVRYDADVSFHGHFKCRHCHRIFDVPVSHEERLAILPGSGFKVESVHLDYYGRCPGCAAAQAGE